MATSTGTDQLRRANTGLVLRALRADGPGSRAEVALRTGLAKATVGAIVADLLEVGAVHEQSEAVERSGVRGRPGRPVALSPGAFAGLGLELNVDYVCAVVVDLAGRVVHSSSRAAGEAAPGVVPEDALLALVAETRAAVRGTRLVGATLAVPALVREDERTIAWAPNLALDLTHGSDLAALLERTLPGCPVKVSNDANCAAYAEAHHGVARGVAHAVYLTGTVGIGAGIIHGGELVTGAAGFAGEVGHMPVGDPTAPCGCGRHGCWEAAIGLRALITNLGMPELDTPVATAAAIAQRASDDPGVRAVVERVGRDVGLGIATLASVLDPEVVVLGGYFVPLGDLVLGPARAVLDERLASRVQVRPELRLSTLDITAAALGAAERSAADALAGRIDLAGLAAVGDPL